MYNYDYLNLLNVSSFQAHSNTINRIKQSPFTNNHIVATCSDDTTIKIWNTNKNWTLIRTYTGHSEWCTDLEFINEDTIVSSSGDYTLQMWSLSTGQTQRTINVTGGIGVSYIVYSLQLLSNGYYLACGLANTNGINVYNLNTGHLISTLYGHTSFVFDLIQLADINLMASSSGDWTVRIWNMTTNRTKFILNGHIDRVFALKLINSEILASVSWDTTIKL